MERSPGCIMRPILTVTRKLKISEFKENAKMYPDRYGIPGSAGWNAKLLQYMNDPVLTIDDIERWVRTHSWITAEDQPPRAVRSTRNYKRSRSLIRETTPTRFQTPRSASSSAFRHPGSNPSPQHIDFENVVNADNCQRTSSSRGYFVEDSHVTSGMQLEENDNGNPLEPPQNHHTQQGPHVYEGLGRRLIAGLPQHAPPQQFMCIPANQMQRQGNSHGNGIGNSSQITLPHGNGNNNWPRAQVSENNLPPSMIVPEDNEDNKSGTLASDLNLGMTYLGELSQICGRHEEFRTCLLHIEKVFSVMQRTQKRTLLVLSHKDALAAAVEAKNKKIIKMEIPDEENEGSVAGRSGTSGENEENDMNINFIIKEEVDLVE